MRIGDTWVGWGLGDNDPKVAQLKEFVSRKFGWVRAWEPKLLATPLYDETFEAIVKEMQRRYGLPVTGIINYATQVAMGFIKPAPPAKPTLFTVCGTGVPWWVGPDADTARAVEHKYHWQPVGYPARPFPMWPSIQSGVAELRLQINRYPGAFALAGYSQGAVVTSLVYKYDILNPAGGLHHRLSDLKKAVTWGSPMREVGRMWPDGITQAGIRNGGILGDRLENTPDWWRDFAHKGDLYADCEMDDEGEMKRAICQVIMGDKWWSGPDSIISQALEITQRPVQEVIAVVKALMDAGMFFGTQTREHVNYNIRPAIDYLLS